MHSIIVQTKESGFHATDAFALGGRLHVEQYVFDVAGLIEADQALGEGFDLVF